MSYIVLNDKRRLKKTMRDFEVMSRILVCNYAL